MSGKILPGACKLAKTPVGIYRMKYLSGYSLIVVSWHRNLLYLNVVRNEVSMEFETIIGLEVHAQLLTKSKMYCRCSADYASAPPNTHVCPVCMGMPGVLPTMNQKAIEYTMMTALALNCSISPYSKFDRKNYPYPDLMKGYQISQYDMPIGLKGWINIEVDGLKKKVGITRVHLEEDVAKMIHHNPENGKEGYSLVDINRAGVPLMEIVGEPDLRTPEEARQYLIRLRSILQYLGVSTGNMEEGSFRCDANISIRPVGSSEFGPKVEVQNMNSFRAVYRAMEYETRRQIQVMEEGGRWFRKRASWVEGKVKQSPAERNMLTITAISLSRTCPARYRSIVGWIGSSLFA